MSNEISSATSRRIAVVLILASAAMLGACRSASVKCAKPGAYVQAQTVAPLRIPANLDAPDTRGALRVPDLNEPEVPAPTVSPCLDQPPRFSNTARLEPPPKEPAKGKDKTPPPPAPPPSAPPAATPPATP
jgi:hypothetical protein